MIEVSEVTITAPNRGWLTTFVKDLLDNRLCASAHIDTIRSMYWWSNEVHNREEFRAILHTQTALIPIIVETTKGQHPYEVPCIAATPITSGNTDYLNWILNETRTP